MAIPFGMKAGDEIFTTSSKDIDGGDSIHQQVEHKSVWQDLLKGEVTQEVEELRYEMYKAEELSNEYEYLGNGQARKKDYDNSTRLKNRKKFTQYNYEEEYGMLESLKMLDHEDERMKDDWKTRKTFKAEYNNPFVRFKLENYAEKVRIDISDDIYRTFLYFIDDNMSRKTRPLVNLAKKTKNEIENLKLNGNDVQLREYIRKSELCSSMSSFKFTTINATNDVPNGIEYNFSNPKFEDITLENGYVIIEYSWKNFEGNKLLSEKFKSKTAEEKFKNKEKRDGYIPRAGIKQSDDDEFTIRHRDDESLKAWIKEEDNEQKDL